MRTKDADIPKLLRMLSLDRLDNIERILEKQLQNRTREWLKRVLAAQLTRLVHGG